jgi:hypothetical protein
VALEDVALEDVALEDVALEDVALEDAGGVDGPLTAKETSMGVLPAIGSVGPCAVLVELPWALMEAAKVRIAQAAASA